MERICFFVSQGDEPKALEFNALKTLEERKAFGASAMLSDITHTIPGNVLWNCNRVVQQYILNGNIALWTPDILLSDRQVYDGCSSEVVDSIYKYGGTNKHFQTTGLPTIFVGYDSYGSNHTSNGFMAGDSVANAKHWCFQETVPAPWGQVDLQPGQSYLPLTTDYFMIYASYLHKDAQGKQHVVNAQALLFKLNNGIYTFVEKSPYLDIIMTRESDPPVLGVQSSVPNKFSWSASDENLKNVWYTVDGNPTKYPIGQSGSRSLNLPAGSHKVVFFAEDYFRLTSKDSVSFDVVDPVKVGPTSISKPTEGSLEDVPVDFSWSSADNASQYNLEVSLNSMFTQLVKDTILFDTVASVKLDYSQKLYSRVRGENVDVFGVWSPIVGFSTKDDHTSVPLIKSLDDLIAYPNPVHDFVNVRGYYTAPTAVTTQLISTNGQVLREFKRDFGVGAFDERLDVDGLLPGDYLLRVKTVKPDGKIEEEIKKVIKER